MTKIAVVLPTYNEKENIQKIIPQILSQNKNISIIAVDDNSPDGTGKILDQIGKKYNGRVKTLHRNKRGVGSAVRDGLKEALRLKADYVVQMDADFSHHPKYLPSLIKGINNGVDITIGSRYAKGGDIISRSTLRNFISRVANFYNRSLLGVWEVKDSAGGFKCSKRTVLKAINLDTFLSDGYSVGIEQLYRIHKKGFKTKEVPIIFNDRNAGNSKMNLREILKYMLTVLRIRLKGFK